MLESGYFETGCFLVLEVNSLFKFKLLSSQIIIGTVLLFLTVTLIFVTPRTTHFSNGTKKKLPSPNSH